MLPCRAKQVPDDGEELRIAAINDAAFMGFGEPIPANRSSPKALKWRHGAVAIPDSGPADGLRIKIAAEVRERKPWLKRLRCSAGFAWARAS
jgi:hypothetical protein